MTTPSRIEIARNFALWGQYFDTGATMSSDEFDAMSEADKLDLLADAFGMEPSEPGKLSTFAENLTSTRSAEDLTAALDGDGADAYDCQAWNLTPAQWRHEVAMALAVRIANDAQHKAQRAETLAKWRKA